MDFSKIYGLGKVSHISCYLSSPLLLINIVKVQILSVASCHCQNNEREKSYLESV